MVALRRNRWNRRVEQTLDAVLRFWSRAGTSTYASAESFPFAMDLVRRGSGFSDISPESLVGNAQSFSDDRSLAHRYRHEIFNRFADRIHRATGAAHSPARGVRLVARPLVFPSRRRGEEVRVPRLGVFCGPCGNDFAARKDLLPGAGVHHAARRWSGLDRKALPSKDWLLA